MLIIRGKKTIMSDISYHTLCKAPTALKFSPRHLDMAFSTSANATQSEFNALNRLSYNDMINLPANDSQNEALAKLGIIFKCKLDNVLNTYKVNSNIKLVNTQDDRVKRIIDTSQNNKLLASIFLKKSTYEYYGYVTL